MKIVTFRLVACSPHKSSGAERQKTFQVYESQNSVRTCTDRPRGRFAADREPAETWRHIAKHCKRHGKRKRSTLKLYWQHVNRTTVTCVRTDQCFVGLAGLATDADAQAMSVGNETLSYQSHRLFLMKKQGTHGNESTKSRVMCFHFSLCPLL